jgi:hypothetical protein
MSFRSACTCLGGGTERTIRVALRLDGNLGDTLDGFLARVTTPAADSQSHRPGKGPIAPDARAAGPGRARPSAAHRHNRYELRFLTVAAGDLTNSSTVEGPCWVIGNGDPALEEQRSEKYRHALITVVSISVRAGQVAGPMPGSRPTWYLTHEYVGRDQACDLQKLQVAPLAVPSFLEGRVIARASITSVPACDSS